MVRQFFGADRSRGFDMARAPLLRLTLLRYGEADHRLIWTYHHIVLDGRSRICSFAKYLHITMPFCGMRT